MGKVVGAIVGVAVIIGLVIFGMSLTKVGQGEVGVVYSMKGGVKDEVLTPGFHFVGPTDKVKDFPVSQQQLVLKGKSVVEAPSNGGVVNLSFTINYNFITDRVTDLYTKFNGMDGDTIVDSMVKNSIIAYIKEVTPNYTVMDIYNNKRAEAR